MSTDSKSNDELHLELVRLQQRLERLCLVSELERDIRSREKVRMTSHDRKDRIMILEQEIGSMTEKLRSIMHQLESNQAVSNQYELESSAKNLKACIHSRKRLRDDHVEKLARLNELAPLKQKLEASLLQLDLSKDDLATAISICGTEIRQIKSLLNSIQQSNTKKQKAGRDVAAKMVFSKDFWHLFYRDLNSARKEIIIVCKFMSEPRVRILAEVLSKAVERGVHATVVIGPPTPENKSLVELMLRSKIEVVIRKGFHQKLSVIDQNIAWHGSLNILSHWNDQGDQMCREQEPHMVQEIASAIRELLAS